MFTLVDDPSCFLHHCDQDDMGLKDDIVGACQLEHASWGVPIGLGRRRGA